ncbi:ABC transporter substrate-binding protein [Halobacterium litoreum]|uniref:ABC transporter substrate-binding protein n=1 Tax=Halobacterium litoreum TaxID=2039234 RepID=A0ABD5NC10_9EURY|nr:ABC transporter substrate-binding protein [Halobacterium litoreum]UHH14528.1 ABC transporter substrate-binding protein [Halobacterium litoreum]
MTDFGTSRRTVLKSLGAAGAAGITGLAGCAGLGGSSSPDNMKIGVMQPLSTSIAYYGQQALWGFLSGLAYKGDTDPIADPGTGTHEVEIEGTTYELVVRDTQFDADEAQSIASNLVTDEEVDMLFGCASSSAAQRVVDNVLSATDIPYMAGPAASASLTSGGESCSNQLFRASENTAMDARSGGKYVAEESDVNSVYLFGADYSFGKAVVNNYERVLSDAGVEIVGKRFVESGHSEWEGLLQQAEEAGAEGVVGGFTVSTLPAMFSQFLQGDYSYRLFGGFATRVATNVLGQTLKGQLGEPLTEEKLDGVKAGPFTTRYHWNQYDNDINSTFVDQYSSAYGTVPDLFSSGTFTAASAIVQAINESGSTDAADIQDALTGMTVTDTPKGEGGYTFQEYNNQARSEMTVANVAPTSDEWSETWQAPIMPSEPLSRVSAEETTIPKDSDQMNCSL